MCCPAQEELGLSSAVLLLCACRGAEGSFGWGGLSNGQKLAGKSRGSEYASSGSWAYDASCLEFGTLEP